MGHLFGKVLMRETYEGVPNLLVSAFDQDPAARGDAAAIDLRREGQSIEGARLGSVITGSDGGFDLEYESWTRGRPPGEIRPDVVLAVFAPEDSAGPEDPKPRPQEQRILYLSRVPRVDASPIEAYVIRLPRAQLERLGIPTASATSGGDPHRDAGALADSIERTWSLRDSVRERLKPRIDREAKRLEDRRKKGKAWAKSLLLPPRQLREHPHFVQDVDTAEKTHKKAIKAGLETLKDRRVFVRLDLANRDLKPLGLKIAGEKIEGKINLDSLSERIFSSSGGPDLVRTRDLVDMAVTPEQRLTRIKTLIESEKAKKKKKKGKTPRVARAFQRGSK